MTSRVLSFARRATAVLLLPSQSWRRKLYLVRIRINREIRDRDFSEWTQRGLDSLLDVSRSQPEALLATVRQLRRVGRLADGLAVAEELWQGGLTTSAVEAFACARVWYDNGRQRQGDMALERARSLAPEWLDIYVEEAHNQRWRGNASAALGAAEHALVLGEGEAHERNWKLFIGEIKFELGQFAEAAELMSGSFPAKPSDEQHYRLGLAYDRVGRHEDAAEQFAKIEGPKGVDGDLRMAAIHYSRENYAEAVEVLKATNLNDSALVLYVRSQLMLGNPSEVVRAIEPSTQNPRLAGTRALALELNDEPAAAVEAYNRLFEVHDQTASDEAFLRRAARAAYVSGDHRLSAELESRCVPRTLVQAFSDVSIPARLEGHAQAVRAALAEQDLEGAAALLLQLAFSSSTRDEVETCFRLLGRVQLERGEVVSAAQSFFRANPYRMPNSEESLDECRALGSAENYAEAWEALPLCSEVVLYESFHGASTSCNPLAICLELMKRDPEGKMQHVWVLKKDGVIHPSLRGKENVHFVVRDSWGYYIHLATAGILVNNTTFPPRFIRKEGQKYLNTWHGTPWKHLGRDIADDPYGHDNAGRNMLQATLNLLPNEHTANILTEKHDIASLIVRRPVVVGSPRVDRTLNAAPERLNQIREQLGLSGTRPVVFYAPTWRGALGALKLDAAPFIAAIEELALQPADIVLRFHHLLVRAIRPESLPPNVIVVPEDIDTNEILALSDVLVSDYSSVIFDFAPLNRPIIKYVFDLEAYVAERGLYFSVDEVPGSVCQTREELAQQLNGVLSQGAVPIDWSISPTAELWATEDGNASQRVVDLLLEEVAVAENPELLNRPRALVSLSGLRANGVTRSVRNLMASLPETEISIQIVVPKAALGTPEGRAIADELHHKADIALYTGFQTITRQENIAWQRMSDLRSVLPPTFIPWVRSRAQRERLRYFRETTFQSVIDFDGYLADQAILIGLGFPDNSRRVYVAHSDFLEEMRTRFPKHRQIAALMGQFTDVVSVSQGAMEQNRDDLAREFAVSAELHHVLPNSLDIEGLIEASKAPLTSELKEWFQKPGLHVVIAARLSVEKNHSTVLEALALLRDEGIEINLLLLGEGPRLSALRAQVKSLRLNEQVFFAGHLSNPYPAISRSEAMLLPSLHEGQGLVLFEAMLLGLPIVASNITGPATVLENGRHGKLVEPTLEGIRSGLRALHENDVPKSQRDVREYQREAISAFQSLIGEDKAQSNLKQASDQAGRESV